MNYSKFTLKNFRSFDDEVQTLNLAQPVASKPGSGLTYIVGLNNSGKTTVIEAMWIKKDHYLNDSERKQIAPEFVLYNEDLTVVRTVKLVREESFKFMEDPDREVHSKDKLFEIISSRRNWDSTANGVDTSTNIIANSSIGTNPRTQQAVNTGILLKDIEGDTVRYNAFTALVKKVIPEFSRWAVGFEGTPYIKYITSAGINHKTDFLGDGVISVIRILAHLFEERDTGLIIDEPELSLHPLAQKNLLKVIAEYAKKRQIIISTHSPYFVSWEYLVNGAKLNRVTKQGDTDSKIYTLAATTTYSGLVSGANWQQPYLMDEVAKEIFFTGENILFLEGQEDVGLLRSEFIDSNILLFGYGVRGCDNFKVALKMAKDLGFSKVSVLIDKGDREDAIRAELEAGFPEYKIIQWNKNDIRDKVPKEFAQKEGYFDIRGQKKAPDQLDDFDEKIAVIKDYFND